MRQRRSRHPLRRMAPPARALNRRFFAEALEDRRMLAAGLYVENFSNDDDDEIFRLLPEPDRPAFVKRPGFDSWDANPNTVFPDGLHILNDLGPPDANFNGTTATGGRYAVIPIGNAPSPPHALGLLATASGRGSVTFTIPDAGTAGGHELDEEVAAVALSVFGFGTLHFEAENGQVLEQMIVSPGGWQRIVVGRDHLLPGGTELGPIRRVTVATTVEVMYIDDVTFEVLPRVVVPPPEARDDLIIVNRRTGVSAEFNPLDNDFLPNFEGTLLGFTLPARGTLHRVGANFIYEASEAFLADPALTDDSFTYTIANSEGVIDSATVTIRLNRPPDGERDVYALPHGQRTALVVSAADGVLKNDRDLDDATLSAQLWTPPLHGTVLLNADGSFTYVTTDPSGEIRSDFFTYALLDGVSEPVSVEVILQVPNTAPVAGDGQNFLAHGTPGPIVQTFGHVDADGDPVRSVTLVNRPLHGDVTLRVVNGQVQFEYAPFSGDLRGSDEFAYRTSDGFAESNVARIEIIVPNSPPIVESFNPYDDDRVAHGARVYEDTAILGPNGSTSVVWRMDDHIDDADGDSLAVSFGPLYDDLGNLVGAPEHGVVTVGPLPGTFSYTPNPGFHLFGSDTFAYRVSDGYELSDIGWVTVFQSLPLGHARSESFTTATDEPLQIGPGVLFGNDYLQGDYPLDSEPDAPAMPAGLRGPLGNFLFVDGGEVNLAGYSGWHQGGNGWLQSDYGGGSSNNPTDRLNDDGSILYIPRAEEYDNNVTVTPPFTGITGFSYAFRYLSPGFETVGRESNYAQVLILVTETPHGDADGVPDEVENYVFTANGDTNGDGIDDALQYFGDGNGDGVLDSQQANVAAVRIGGADNPDNSAEWVIIESSGNTTLFDVQSVTTLPSPGEEGPLGGALPLGMFSFRVVGLGPGEATTVTIRPRGWHQFQTYYKYGLEPEDRTDTPLDENSTPHWYEFMYDGHTGAEIFDDDGNTFVDRIVLHFIDGQRGDDDLRANGVILDPGGPATLDPIAPPTAPQVAATVVQDGMRQRSFVDRLSIDFSGQVDLAGAIADGSIASIATLTNLGVDANADADRSIPLSANQFRYGFDAATGLSRLTWSLDAFAGTGASLPDGVYRFALDSARIADLAGDALDGDRDGAPGGDYAATFHRLQGDANGDLIVDKYDMKLVNAALGTMPGADRWNANADLDRDGSVTVRDRVMAARATGREILLPNLIDVAQAAFLGGDFTRDGAVDGADFLAWQRGLGGAMNAADLLPWIDNFGIGAADAAFSATAPVDGEPLGIGAVERDAVFAAMASAAASPAVKVQRGRPTIRPGFADVAPRPLAHWPDARISTLPPSRLSVAEHNVDAGREEISGSEALGTALPDDALEG